MAIDGLILSFALVAVAVIAGLFAAGVDYFVFLVVATPSFPGSGR